MYYIEMLAIWRVSTPSGVMCLDSRAIAHMACFHAIRRSVFRSLGHMA